MFRRWPIRNKLLLGAGMLAAMVAILAGSSFYGLYAYRGLVKVLSARSTELPLAASLGHQVGDLQVTLSEVRGQHVLLPATEPTEPPVDSQLVRERFRMHLQAIRDTLVRYRTQLDQNIYRDESGISDDRDERETLARFETALVRVEKTDAEQDWLFDDAKTGQLREEVERLSQLAAELPSFMHQRLQALNHDVRAQYRTAIILNWVMLVGAVAAFVVLTRLFYQWVFQPLRTLIEGSRMVAQGEFNYRIHLDTHDEMSELAAAMNDMTGRFRDIRDDLDRQVRERTKQVVRSEQLASVGFLAAGVAHEINNPLASIAICSESLETRVRDLLYEGSPEHETISNYLKMIQQEAFRCKEITEKLLDFSRMGDIDRQRVELRELVRGVIDMVGHLGRYQEKHVELADGPAIYARVNQQEMKQVVLNLVTNALDSLDSGGRVLVEIVRRGSQVELSFTDNGCGMTEEVLEHLFEPFFTRRRGGQGTGLGLSITYRIIADHDGHIEAHSDGLGRGSRFVVTLPLVEGDQTHGKEKEKEREHRYQAA